LTLKVDSSVTIYNTDTVGIQTSGLLGEKSIAIIPKIPAKGIVPKPVGKEPIYAQSTDPIENAFTELSDLADQMESTFKYLNEWLNKHGDDLAGAVTSFQETMEEAKKSLATINETEVIQAAKKGICNFSLAMDRVQSSLKEMQDGKFFGNANQVMSNINSITQEVSDGKGTLGKLITGDDMYLQLSAILSKGNTLMNDINHYGILFHLNKSWQRQRLQKVRLLDSLNSPAAFQSYFETQIDEINTAMSRISMLIEKAENSENKERIFKNKIFAKDFAELLREVDQLSNNLQLYNEQLQEAN
jgi:phospholipid/cholesterol/gamma-HCH transport system substrate-binding protein